eukprot:gene1564-2346_t
MENANMLSFRRVDLLAMSSMNRGCLRVIPRSDGGKTKRQKVVAADVTGLLNCFQLDPKTNEVKQIFKANSIGGKPFSQVDLVDDRVFVASGDCLRAFTKKGREFFKVETNLTEAISNMAVKTPWVWTAGDYTVACFEEGNEIAYLNCPDRINDLIVSKVLTDKSYDAVIACQDRMIRVVHQKSIALEEPCDGGVLSLCEKPASKMTRKDQQAKELLWGTQNGFIGSFKHANGGLAKQWTLENEKRAGVTALAVADVTGDGLCEILVGRDDGTVEVLGFAVGSSVPDKRYSATVNESVQSVDAGCVVQNQLEDWVISSYTGKVIAFTADTARDEIPVKSFGGTIPPHQAKQIAAQNAGKKKKVDALLEDVDKLKMKLKMKKEEYGKVSSECVAVAAQHHVQDKFMLDSSAAWNLSIEIDAPIDTVVFQSCVDVELLDIDLDNCIISTTPPDDTSKLLAIYRCTDQSSRVSLKVRTTEGQHGAIHAFIMPQLEPKTCQMTSYEVKPLSLHQRLNEIPELPAAVNTMRVDGSFQVHEMHSWVGACLPEVPSVMHGDKASYFFSSTFQGTVLKVTYRNSEAIFESDNISTLTILWDFISRLATAKKVKLQVNVDSANLAASCRRVLQLLHPKLEYQLSLSGQVALIEALKEIEMQEQDVSFLSDNYLRIIEGASTIEKEHSIQPRRLGFLHNLVKRLYID